MVFELTGRAVHVWRVSIRAPAAIVDQFRPFLSPDETERAARFKFEHLQHSFILARGALRVLLGRYLNTVPAALSFTYGSKGKPALGGRLQFNASHSSALALFAFTMDCELGVDVEALRAMPDIEDVARRFFCSEETQDFMALPAAQRNRGFFLCWTRKEAYIKAIGEGLSAPLDSFRVTLRPGEDARMVHCDGDPQKAREWTLHDLNPGPGYAAALAYRDSPRPLEIFEFINPKQLLELL